MASVHKRTGKTGATAYQVKYRTPAGDARSQTFRLKRDADRFARDVESAKDAGAFVDPRRGTVTLGEWSTTWLGTKANLAASTRERYEGIISAHVVPQWGRTALVDVTHEGVQEWLAELGEDQSAASVRKIHRVTSQALDYAVKAGRLVRNPAKGVSLPRVGDVEKRYLSHRQVEDLAVAVGPQWGLLVRLLAYTGLRWGEMAALRVGRVDLERRRILVEESVTPVKGVMTWGATKGHERRKVPVPWFLARELEEHMVGLDADELLFRGARGAVLRAGTFRRSVMNGAAEQLGLCEPKLDAKGRPVTRLVAGVRHPVFTSHLHPHELRHTAASLAIASGADVKVVQTMLGHKSATMTLDLYGHLFPDRLDVVADAMEAARDAALAACSQSVPEGPGSGAAPASPLLV